METIAPNQGLLDMLLELQALDRVPRTGYLLRGITECESVTEHSWHLVFLVWAIAPRVPDLDHHHALELALIHDLAEVRTGDLPRSGARYFPPGAKRRGEEAAVNDILAPVGQRALELYAEYEAGRSREARLVRACDKLQLLIKASVYEGWGATGLEDFWSHPEDFPHGDFPVIQELVAALRRRREGHRPSPGRLP